MLRIKIRYSRDPPGGPVAETPFPQFWGPGSIPGQGNRSHMLQLSLQAEVKDPTGHNKTRCSQINIKKTNKTQKTHISTCGLDTENQSFLFIIPLLS